MILFPNAKINLGLFVTSRRPDGYHDLSTVMVPIGWHDILEIVPSKGSQTTLTTFGRAVDCPPEKNLVMKAYNALSAYTGGLPPVDFYLEKIIPDGAGLGGGSADASFALMGLNEIFNIGLPKEVMAEIAVKIGADCPFFIYNKPALCEGIGDKISILNDVSIKEMPIVVAKPAADSVSTAEAYGGISVRPTEIDLAAVMQLPPNQWHNIRNDFEDVIFPRRPIIAELKEKMLSLGAVYAAMSGSGASVYGIFDSDILAQKAFDAIEDCDKIITRIVG